MWLYRCFPALRPLWSLYWRFRLTGAVDSIPRSGPLLVAANHACFLDPWFLAVVFPRPIHYPGSPVAERIPNRRALEFRDDLFRAISRLVGDAHLPELSAPRAVTEPVGRTSPRRG